MFAEYKPYSLKIKNKPFAPDGPVVMGILNTTEDSFFDGGKYHTTDQALFRCEAMLNQGAAIIDIGGQSTRPGAEMQSTDEELRRTVPIIAAIAARFPEALISIDTFRASVARQAIEAGACMVNDVSAGEDDADMLQTVAGMQVPYIAMHKQGIPKTMQDNPQYRDVCSEVINYLDQRLALMNRMGINDVILDPGFGFGKTLEHNYSLLKHLNLFHTLNRPLLIGVSRKSMVCKLLKTNPEHALNGSTALHMLALMQGAHILRVHDVKEAVECVRIASFIRSVS